MNRAVLLCVLGFAGCGGEDSPVEKCEDLLAGICDRAVVCISEEVGSHDNCVRLLEEESPCGSVMRVSTTYDRCVTQISESSCSTLFEIDMQTGEPSVNLPADCLGVFAFAPRGAISGTR